MADGLSEVTDDRPWHKVQGSYLENTGYRYASVVSVLRGEVARDRRFQMLRRASRTGRRRLEKELERPRRRSSPSGKEQERGCRDTKKETRPQCTGLLGLLSMGRGVRRVPEESGRSVCERQSVASAQSSARLTHLHKHPLDLHIVLQKLVLVRRKDKEEVQTLQEQGREPGLSHSGQRLLRGKSSGERAEAQVRPRCRPCPSSRDLAVTSSLRAAILQVSPRVAAD